jgi:hypothetical protein
MGENENYNKKTFAKTKTFCEIFHENKNFFQKPSGPKIFRENFRENEYFRENKHFWENFPESENFRKTKFFKKRANFRLFSLEKRGFHFKAKLTLFINMLKLHKITISERVAEP